MKHRIAVCAAVLALITLMCTACTGVNTDIQSTPTNNADITIVPISTATLAPTENITLVPVTNTPAVTLEPNMPKLEVGNTVAHLFDNGKTLYAGVEFMNAGNCSLIITNAKLTFTSEGASEAVEFVPMLSSSNVVMSGSISYITYWAEAPEGFSGKVSVSAELEFEVTELERRDLTLSELKVYDNYPGFATLSGMLMNFGTEECLLNMLYVAFYDENDVLLGVWHFSENAVMKPNDIRSFVVDMTELPISNLAENTAYMRSSGFGIG